MPWEVSQQYVVKIGGNYFENCGDIVTYNDQPLFNIKRRQNDLRLGIDFDIYDQHGKRIAIVRKGNVVEGEGSAYDIRHGSECHMIVEKATGRVICQIDKHPREAHVELAVTVRLYLPDGFLLEADPDSINLGSCKMIGNTFSGLDVAIAIGRSDRRAAIKLRSAQQDE